MGNESQSASAETTSVSDAEILTVSDDGRVRTLTLNRPEALNAFSEALYDAVTVALQLAAADDSVSVVVLTGAGRAFSAGNDLDDMRARFTDPDYQPGVYGFKGMIETLVDFPKPFICAVNGIGVGVGTTILGHADMVFMSSTAKLQCPFTKLGVAPEAGSSYLMPQLLGRQNASWLLMSSEWIQPAEALQMSLVWKVCEPHELLSVVKEHADILAAKPVASLMAVKRTIAEVYRPHIKAANEREIAQFGELLGAADNVEALDAFSSRKGTGR